ncbi:MAG: hypothetical protein ACOX2K_03395 [Bacillota bacterium]|jgi:hypothetical protein
MADRLKVRALGFGALALALFSLFLPGGRSVFLLLYLAATVGFLWMARRKDLLGYWLLTIAHGLLGLGLLFQGRVLLFLWLLGVPLGLLGYVNLSNLVDWQDVF